MQNQQYNLEAVIAEMASHLANASVTSELFTTGAIPVVKQVGRLAAELGKVYADVRGSAAMRLEQEYGFSPEQAVAASASVDPHISKAMDIIAAVLLAKQGS
jgi:hypothetical protein